MAWDSFTFPSDIHYKLEVPLVNLEVVKVGTFLLIWNVSSVMFFDIEAALSCC